MLKKSSIFSKIVYPLVQFFETYKTCFFIFLFSFCKKLDCPLLVNLQMFTTTFTWPIIWGRLLATTLGYRLVECGPVKHAWTSNQWIDGGGGLVGSHDGRSMHRPIWVSTMAQLWSLLVKVNADEGITMEMASDGGVVGHGKLAVL